MSQNQNLDATWQYHSGTKHSYVGLRTNPHSLDWKNKPLLFKIYPTLEVTRLPRDFRETGVPALSAIAAAEPSSQRRGYPRSGNSGAAAVLLRRSHSQQETSSKEKFSFAQPHAPARSTKSNSTSSARICKSSTDSPPLPAGVYHFGAAEFGLRQLRSGDFRQALVEATGSDPSVAHAPVIIVCSALTGATPGNIAPAPTAISAGTTARSSPTCSPVCRSPRSFPPELSPDSSTRR